MGLLSTVLGSPPSAALSVVLLPVILIDRTLVYFDLRVRKDGYTLADMAREVGM